MKTLKLMAMVLAFALAAPGADFVDCQLVPGWEQSDPAREFTADNLFEYVDGNAEGYLIYGFVRMRNLTCKSGADSVVVDVSEMADPEGAYGIFAAHRDPDQPVAKIGMGGQVLARRALFAKGKYYVGLAAHPGEEYRAALRAFVAEIEKRIPGRSTPPEALSWFSSEQLISVRLIPESVLGLSALKRGYAAQYEYGKAIVVEEESAESAAGVMEKLRQRFGETAPAEVADEAFEAEDRYLGRLCFFRKGRFIAGFANLAESQNALALAKTLARRIP